MQLDKLQENDRVHHAEYGNGTVIQIFKFSRAWERRSRFPYLVKFDSGFQEQFVRGELMKGTL